MKQQGVKNGGTSGKNGGEIKFHKEWGFFMGPERSKMKTCQKWLKSVFRKWANKQFLNLVGKC